MKQVFSPLAWLLIAFIVAQGTIAGLVICLGEGGHVEIERAQGECCDPSRQPAPEWAGYLVATAPEPSTDDSCGSCTDSPLSLTTLSRIKTLVSGEAYPGPLETAQRSYTPVVVGIKQLLESRSVVAKATRIPIATTTLLI